MSLPQHQEISFSFVFPVSWPFLCFLVERPQFWASVFAPWHGVCCSLPPILVLNNVLLYFKKHCSFISLVYAGVAILTINSKKITKPFKVWWGYIFLCNWRGVGKKRRKKGKGVVGKFSCRIVCQNIIPFSLLTHSFTIITKHNLFIHVSEPSIQRKDSLLWRERNLKLKWILMTWSALSNDLGS